MCLVKKEKERGTGYKIAGFNAPWTEILKFFLTSHIDFWFIFGQHGDN